MAENENQNIVENEQKNDIDVDEAPKKDAAKSPEGAPEVSADSGAGKAAEQDTGEDTGSSEEDDLEAQMAAAMAVEGEESSAGDDLEAEMAATMALETEEDSDDLNLEAQMAAAIQEDSLEEAGGVSDFGGTGAGIPDVSSQPLDFQQLRPSDEMVDADNIDRLLDVSLNISVELGRKQMQIKEILGLGPGKIIELDKLAGEPVDLLVNGKLLAKGEVVVVDENFGVRITDLINPQDRIKML